MIRMKGGLGVIIILLFFKLRVLGEEVNVEGEDEVDLKDSREKNGSDILSSSLSSAEEHNCPTDVECYKLGDQCVSCDYNYSCVYGEKMNVTCHARVDCIGNKKFQVPMMCRYCYQTDPWEHRCVMKTNCVSVDTPLAYYKTNCTVRSEIRCLGRRRFLKKLRCNWTGGYRWSTALILSVTLGGFGADRFYLGHWQEGIGKLFSFGGLGVWTLVDVMLISIHYLGPADGSLYI
ncbi:TM2 domain-containing protein almondex [Ischnura elegans]|uniref:TM2 domain-containing protein almondex n=1 Tax=Ischnura elegans TaxID=197161 RepID=UPI001ED8B7EA|nr:TM2 domain-containing protein almondex [Ischnura elegans]